MLNRFRDWFNKSIPIIFLIGYIIIHIVMLLIAIGLIIYSFKC